VLQIAKNEALTDIVSAENPITTQHPVEGSTEEVRVWVFNTRVAEETSDKRYELVSVDPSDTTGTDESTWIQLATDNGGVAGVYQANGEALALGNVDTLDTGIPVWVRITTPTVNESQNKADIVLNVTGREFAV
jgi:hypothetical protein